MIDKYVIVDLATMDFFKDDEGNLIYLNSQNDACEVCVMYEFKNVWVAKLIYNHIENDI